jgi:signal transduction histidine kinase/ActR/RegA family two-component response regulator
MKADLLDLLVPPGAREHQRERLRHRGIAKSLLSISGVAAILFLAYLLVRPEATRQEWLLFAASTLSPLAGALFVRLTGRIHLGLFLTNLAGIGIVAFWCWVTGGIVSVALPWFLPNLFLLSTFGSRRMLLGTATILLVVIGLLFLATQQGWLPPNQVPAGLIPTFTLLSIASGVAVVVVAAVAVTAEREKSKQLLFAAKNAAEAANRAKSAFLSSMSHELRTPLNAVLLAADLLKEDQDPPLSPRQAEVVDQFLQGGEILLGLVNQVLVLSSLEAGNVSIATEEVVLSEVLSGSLAAILPLSRHHQVRVDCDPEALSGLLLLADPGQLKSVLINLLSNAVKYNHPQGRVEVRARMAPEARVRVEIQDTGPGISDQMRQALFQPFNRLGAEGLHIEGVGLGLSITERLVRMMSGSLGVESIPGQGSTFWVELPAAAGSRAVEAGTPSLADPVSQPAPPNPAPARPLDVLVVEDHPVNQQLMRRVLEKWGHQVTLASNGEEALKALHASREAHPFDVILMDLLMPVMDGLEATRSIRRLEQDSGRHIPIVAVTACALDQDREACLEAGMDDYLAKPVKSTELARVLERIPAGVQAGPLVESKPLGS